MGLIILGAIVFRGPTSSAPKREERSGINGWRSCKRARFAIDGAKNGPTEIKAAVILYALIRD